MAILDLSFGEGDASFGASTIKYKGVSNQTDRITLANLEVGPNGFPIAGAKPKFIGAKRHYLNGVGYFLSNGPEFVKLAGGPPKEVAATVVIKWPTNSDGELIKERLLTDWQVMSWVFSSDKYKSLRGINRQFPLQNHDVLAACTDAGFQKMNFTPCNDGILATLIEKGATEIVTKIMAAVANTSAQLEGLIGHDYTMAQIRDKLAGGAGGPSGGGGGGASVPRGGAPVDGSFSPSDLDDMLIG